ncbi:hypothetical protein MYCTH_2311537 [Thermothelomyces thermophilus ATCC 42464]|uniref:Transcription initiation factor TFIID subunit 4 n=1 Tax=Thermothelomyces thermophilus (strain ATCC 42464 / BCRC 31852 / DSM 1799) TaxID=573729 RepID=G2QP96_THET4|nr:uncharacterized protein MYCTH_2311537 [Thermothelomyces thermophilus ATCC 42464]AEO61409.1 hypothetical protein MYCTH_2311537 [Thermothelomyces thermophilus ATCC 42464]
MAQPQSQVPQAPPHQVPHGMPQMQQMQQMQMPQMQQQRPSYSPPQHSPSPAGTPQPGYAVPPNKRPRTSPTSPPSHPQSPYVATPYTASPQMTTASPAPVTSPGYSNLAAPAGAPQYNTAHTNGNSAQSPAPTPMLSLPDTRPSYPSSPAPSGPATAPTPPASQQYTTATMAPVVPPPPAATPGTMGPPSKPPAKEIEYDVADSLAGTGIDLRAEEQFLAEFYAGSFTQDARTGLPANAPGGKGSFYGAGMANQPGEAVGAVSQEAYEAEAAQKAWDEAAHRLAVVRSNEINNPFLMIANLHHRVEKIAKEHGLSVNLDLKNANPAGKLRPPQEFPPPKVTVSTKPGPDGVMVTTTGSFIPHDAYLVDQLALLSIATKHRLRELIEDANAVAIHRQTTSHGEIPAEWADVAVPLRTGLDSLPDDPESAALLKTRKRSFDAYASQGSSLKGGKHGPRNLMEAVRDGARIDRDLEEARLRKRQKRLNPEPAAAASRAGSVAPGIPGTGAGPETETAAKAPSKKELKKGAAAARLAEASSTASTNQTLSTLMGGFGRKKKEYSWMKKSGSGTSTPRAIAGDAGSAAGGDSGKVPEKTSLTSDARYPRLGTWREDKEKGRNIQLRDWVTALELDGIETRAIQQAYLNLDSSGPKDRS